MLHHPDREMSSLPTLDTRSTLATLSTVTSAITSGRTSTRSSPMSSISERRKPAVFHHNSNGTMAFRWTIANFQANVDNKFYLQRVFTNDGDLEWKLVFYTCFDDINYSSIQVCLKGNATDYEIILARMEVAIINSEDQRMYGQSIRRKFFSLQEYFFKFIERDSFNSEKLLVDGKLILEFKIDVIDIKMTRALKHQILISKDVQHYLWSDVIEKKNLTFNDVVLIANNKEAMRAHAAILAARSETFRQKLITERLTQKGNSEFEDYANLVVLVIDDIKYEMLMAVVEYIYRAKVVGIEHLARDLFPASCLYRMNNLCILCEDTLIDSLNMENAADLLIYAHVNASKEAEGSYGTKKLKHMALEFIKENRPVARTDGFKRILDEYPDLVITVVEFL